MRDRSHWALSLLGVMALCLGSGGCAAQRDQELRLSEELGRARADATWEHAHSAELEARLSRIEQRLVANPEPRSSEQRELLTRLDRVLALNERMLAERAPAPPAAASPSLPATPTSSVATNTPAAASSDEDQLRALVERTRGRPGRRNGVLTREENDALRVLTKPERQLDVDNPWPANFY